jgi:hypothetical protein
VPQLLKPKHLELGLCNQRKPVPSKEDTVQPKNKFEKIQAEQILKSFNSEYINGGGWREGLVLMKCSLVWSRVDSAMLCPNRRTLALSWKLPPLPPPSQSASCHLAASLTPKSKAAGLVPSLCHPTFLGYSFTCATATWFADQAKILELTQNLHAD